eukprot:CAMPEP_0169154666 /NCGR_PEP_ID=MMETSP1015-20121227/52866_1 /TAXON_ID=342587 /ORGANISM="Karlodinium micrum, Strain CCMP2283" /LENGTH=222 /DNA_ID=CAMNT_0009224937 /DNA_START=37 /DNA_END=706 /DNA_ORIENTATION=-
MTGLSKECVAAFVTGLALAWTVKQLRLARSRAASQQNDTSESARASSLLEVHAVAPELVTLFCNSGASFDDLDSEERLIQFQVEQLLMQLQMEDCFASLGHLSQKPVILLVDRGTLDGAAYVTEQQWQEVLKRTGLGEDNLLLDRYDAVIHLVSAADGAEKYYDFETNDVRFEGLQEARETDARTRSAWSSHPRLHIIDNSTDFEGKFRRVELAVGNVLAPQ